MCVHLKVNINIPVSMENITCGYLWRYPHKIWDWESTDDSGCYLHKLSYLSGF